MSYCSSVDISVELKHMKLGDANSQVKTADVEDFIDQADAVIDMYVGKRYETPIVGVKSLQILRKISIDLVTYRVVKILDLSKSNPIPDAQVVQEITEGSAYRESMKILKDIRDNLMSLPDATLLDSAGGLASFHTEAGNSEITPFFDITKQQW